MSDTENNTENKAETKTVDTAPYLKKDKAEKPSKSNFVIPVILLLVSAIVIVATFYDDEYSDLLANVTPDSTSSEHEGMETKTDEVNASTAESITQNENTSTESAASLEQVSELKTLTASTSEATSETSAEDASATSPATEVATEETEKDSRQQPAGSNIAAVQQVQQESSSARGYSRYSPYPRRPGMQNPVKAHTQEQAQKYNEIMQQRRLAYEKEMQARQEKYEAAKKAQMKRRAEIMAAKKAEFERMEKNRIEAAKKIDALRKQIVELQKEIYQIMQSSRPPQKTNPPVRPLQR